jgi:GTP-binding protein HflX
MKGIPDCKQSRLPASEQRPGERTLIVACEFTGRKYRQRLGNAARLARDASRGSEDALDIPDRESQANRGRADEISEQTAECKELAESAGANVLDIVVQRRDHPDPATLIGKGKLEELAGTARHRGVDLIIFEQDLSPSQLRELERALPCRVIDRTQLILDIFASHARTREGQLQVELAQLEYMLPRLAGRGRAMSQLGGGIGTRGPGETQLETDRRKIGRRIQTVRERLEAVRRIRRQQRQRRSSVPVPTVALVGYTNAGKSTLFNALTQAGVLESSRMFATLDPKLHLILLPSRRKVLLSDTVGFIRDLPHTLVQAFRATLEEVQTSEVLIHVMDASSPSLQVHRQEVEKVLKELEADSTPRMDVLNKIDRLTMEERAALAHGGGNSDAPIAVSAMERIGLDELLARLDAMLASDPLEERWLDIPQQEGAVLAALDAGAVVLERKFTENTAHLRVRGSASLLGRYREYWRANGKQGIRLNRRGRTPERGSTIHGGRPTGP